MNAWLSHAKASLLSLISGFILCISSAASHALILTDTHTISPFDPYTDYAITFDFGGPLSNITAVDLFVDPCNVWGNELPIECSDSIGIGEPVAIDIADLTVTYLPANASEIDVMMTESLLLTAALLADLADGRIGATVSTILTGADFVDFTLQVTTSETVPEPSTLFLVGLGLAGLFVANRRRVISEVHPAV